MADTVTVKEFKITSEFISEDSDDFPGRFSKIIQAALNRASAAEAFFNVAAQNASDRMSKAYFFQLANQKARHRRIIEKIDGNSKLLFSPANAIASEYAKPAMFSGDSAEPHVSDHAACLTMVFEQIYEKAIDELDFYLNFLLIEKHPIISSLLFSLANLSKDFLFEAKLRYLEHQSKMKTGDSQKIIDHFLSLERRLN